MLALIFSILSDFYCCKEHKIYNKMHIIANPTTP